MIDRTVDKADATSSDRTDRTDSDSAHNSESKDAADDARHDSPKLGEFAHEFEKYVSENGLDFGTSDPVAKVRNAPELEKPTFGSSLFESRDFYLLSRGGDGSRNDWAGFRLALAAASQIDSVHWQAIPGGPTFCNVFAYDVGTQAGLIMPSTNGLPANTAFWAGTSNIRCWSQATAKTGNLFAFNDSAGHHMGVVTDASQKLAVSAGATRVKEYQHWATDASGVPRYIENQRDKNDLSGRSEVKFYEYTCSDFSRGRRR